MKKLFYITIMTMLIFVGKNINAQTTTAVPFLLLAPDSRAGGIGESGVGLADNAAAIFWNPAGIAFLTGSEISLTHSNWLANLNIPDLFYEYFAYRQYIESIGGSLTASITFMNFGEFIRTNSSGQETGKFNSFDGALTVGYATKLSDDWGLGFNFRLIHSKLSDKPTELEEGEGKATTVSFDIAAMWRPEELNIPFVGDMGNRFSLGMNLSNLGPKISYIDQAQADPLPTNFRLGTAIRLFEDDFNSLTYTLDFSKLLVTKIDPNDTTATSSDRDEFYKAIFTAWADDPIKEELRDVVTSMGLEYWYGAPENFMFALRTGFFYEDPDYGNRKFITIGAGIRYQDYAFDFSYITTSMFKNGEDHPLSETIRFSLSIGWDNVLNSNKGFPRGL